jgi:two-component system, cell cycle sensor histidine kinase and response regulator CckA
VDSTQSLMSPAKREFVAVAVFAVLLNLLFQFLLVLLSPIPIHPTLRALLETFVVALFVVVPACYFYRHPLRVSLRKSLATERTLRKSEMHYRIVSELTTTFVFDLLVDREGKVSLDFISDSFYSFAGRAKQEVRTFESLLDHIHPEDRRDVIDGLKKLIASPQSTEIECRAHVDDPHQLRWLSISGRSEANEPHAGMTIIYGAVKDITQRRLADEEQRRVKNLLAVSQRLAHIGSWEYDLTTQTLSLSDEMYRMAGLPIETPMNREIVESFFPPDELTRSRRFLSSLSREDSIYRSDYKVQRGDGTSIVIHSEGEIIRDEQANAIRIVGTTQDITARKEAEEALRESEQVIQAMLNAIPAGVFWKDTNLVFLGCNRRFAIDAGFSDPKEIVGKDDYEIGCPREHADFYRSGDRAIIESGESWLNVEDFQLLNGRPIAHLTSRVPLLKANGQMRGVLGTYVDITERRLAEEALFESEAKFRSIIEQSADGILISDDIGRITEWNAAQEAITGLRKEDVVGKPIWDVQHLLLPAEMRNEAFLSHLRETFETILAGGSGWATKKRENAIVRSDGTQSHVSSNTFVVNQGGKRLIVSIMRDINERIESENARKVFDQYVQQTQRLDSLGVLAGGIAHDFNNILMSIFGFTDLARQLSTSDALNDYLAQAMAGMERAKGLTQQLLTFSKGGSPVRRVTALPDFVKECVQFSLSGTSLRSDFDFSDDLFRCEIDKNQVGQVIQNIVINAVQAMPLGGTLSISCLNRSLSGSADPTLADGNYVVISIRDQGIGISEEMLARIFDPFFTTKPKGHGLGLAISYSIVQKHGGAIKVSSLLGKGSTFEVWLPACDEAVMQDAEASEDLPKGFGRLLVMDDDESILGVLKVMLERLGYSVACTSSGAQTVEYFTSELKASRPIDGVILDLTVPGGIGGREVAAEIRKLSTSVPLFVSSGYSDDPILANPTEFGFSASIAKPFSHSELAKLLEKHLKGR